MKTKSKDFIICPNCGKKTDRTNGSYPDFCPDCGEDMTIRLGGSRLNQNQMFDNDYTDVMDFPGNDDRD